MNRDAVGLYGHAVVATPSGHKLLRVTQFLFTIPPKLDILTGFDLSHEEPSLFSCFVNMVYFSGLLRNTSMPQDTTLSNRATNPFTYYLPRLPTTYTLGPIHTRSSVTSIKFGRNISMSVEGVRSQIMDETAQVAPGKPVRLETVVDHGPYALRVSPELIRSGFYQRLNDLQGRRRSFWTGAAWHTYDSSLLWIHRNNNF
jgi:hypothetical protein